MSTDTTPVFEVEMQQGADWNCTVNWYGGGTERAVIEELDPGYPTRIRVTAHGLPTSSDTPIIISGVQGVEMVNSSDTGVELCARVDDDYFDVPVSSRGCEWVIGTGEITWSKPSDITSYTARAKLRKNRHSATVIHEYTTENGGIVLDANDASIKLVNTAAETAAMSFTEAMVDVELVSPGGAVTRTHTLLVTFNRETTK